MIGEFEISEIVFLKWNGLILLKLLKRLRSFNMDSGEYLDIYL
jgi:hypothetical protein